MKSHSWIVLCAAMGFGAGLYFHLLLRHSEPVAQSSIARAEREPAQGSPFARQLPLQPDHSAPVRPAAVQPPSAAFSQPPANQMSPAAANPADVLANFEEQRAQSESRMKENLATIAANYDREARDQRWSNEVGESLRAAFSTEELAGATVQSIDCRTTTCRVEVQDDGSGNLPAILPMIAVQMAGSLPNLTAERLDEPNGKTTMVLYMSR